MTKTTRIFEKSDWLGALINCPHCNQMLKVIEADGPYLGMNPELGLDFFWIFKMEDGESCRMWEDRKGIVVTDIIPSNN